MYDVHEICLLATLGSFWLKLLPILNTRQRHMTDAFVYSIPSCPCSPLTRTQFKGLFLYRAIDAPMQSCQPLLNLEVEVGNSRVIVWRIQLLP